MNFYAKLLACGLALFVTACGGGSDSSNATSTGKLSLDVTDAPADDVTQVKLTITAITIKANNASPTTLEYDEPLIIENLLDLQNGNVEQLLANATLPSGRYQYVRLHISPRWPHSYVVTDSGAQVDLLVPGQQSNNDQTRWLKLVGGFTVPANGTVHLTTDIDLRRALTKPSNKDYYLLRPAIRVVDNNDYGRLQGEVSSTLIEGGNCTNNVALDQGHAVYLYNGHDAIAGDIYLDELGEPLSENNPVSVAPVTLDTDSGSYHYQFNFITTGSYTVAFTCQSINDNPDTADAIEFLGLSNIDVIGNETSMQDF